MSNLKVYAVPALFLQKQIFIFFLFLFIIFISMYMSPPEENIISTTSMPDKTQGIQSMFLTWQFFYTIQKDANLCIVPKI